MKQPSVMRQENYIEGNAKKIFFESTTYFIASQCIEKEVNNLMGNEGRKDSKRIHSLVDAAIVNNSFSVELLLKCLSVIQTREYCMIHDLKKLFDKISCDVQGKIIDCYNNNHISYFNDFISPNGPKYDFITLLTEAKDTFPELRYSFQKYPNKRYLLVGVIKSIKEIILELMPDINDV
jgi:HEPN domain-containing protein